MLSWAEFQRAVIAAPSEFLTMLYPRFASPCLRALLELTYLAAVIARLTKVQHTRERCAMPHLAAHGWLSRLERLHVRHPVHEHDDILDAAKGLETPRPLVMIPRYMHSRWKHDVLRLVIARENAQGTEAGKQAGRQGREDFRASWIYPGLSMITSK